MKILCFRFFSYFSTQHKKTQVLLLDMWHVMLSTVLPRPTEKITPKAEKDRNIHALSPAIAGALPKGEPFICAPRKFICFS